MSRAEAAMKALRDAIATFDAGSAERRRLWTTAGSDDELDTARTADRNALDLVREAFWGLTKDRNSRKNCMMLDTDFMRRIAQLDHTKFGGGK